MSTSADFRRRLGALSPLQRSLLARRLDAQVVEPTSAASAAQLVAYVVPEAQASPSTADVRAFLKAHVPDFMVPSAVVVLDELPRTPNGKVDRNALPAPGPAAPSEASPPPRNPVEERLATIWSEVLGLEQVGVYDNFFEVGGDSIASIQIISRANQAGMKLKPGQFFEHPTIAALASVAAAAGTETRAEPVAAGPVPLTPIQHWFFEQHLPDPSHWNQTLSLDLAANVDVDLLEEAFQIAVHTHDAFRLRFAQEADGWSQRLAEPGVECMSVAHHDLSATPLTAREKEVEQIWATSHELFDLPDGPLLHAAFVNRGAEAPYRLILTAHHLVVDVVSWQTLLGDVETVYGQLGRGEKPQPTPPETPFSRWAEALAHYARSAEVEAERAYWLDQAKSRTALPADGDGANTEGSAETIIVQLDPQETQALTDATAAYGMKVHELVLTALAGTLADWSGGPQVRIDFESHGRVEIDETLDIARTAGWFTTIYPVTLQPGSLGDPRQALTQVKEQLRAVPRQGIGYGVLRYLGDAADRQRLGAARADVLFNYMGHAYPGFDDASPFREPIELWGSHGPDGQRAHLIEINALIDRGSLTIRWTYSPAIHHPATIERLASESRSVLQSLVAHCLTPDAGAYTPSDFPDVDLSQDDLDALLGDFE